MKFKKKCLLHGLPTDSSSKLSKTKMSSLNSRLRSKKEMIDKEMTTIKSKDKTNAKTTKTKRTSIKNSSIRKDDIFKFIFGI